MSVKRLHTLNTRYNEHYKEILLSKAQNLISSFFVLFSFLTTFLRGNLANPSGVVFTGVECHSKALKECLFLGTFVSGKSDSEDD